MSELNCTFNEKTNTYNLLYKSLKKQFDVNYVVNCPDFFDYKPVCVYDGFIFAILFNAMECGETLNTDLPITANCIRNANYLIEAWNNMLPNKYKKIQIHATNVILNRLKVPTNKAISAFSGGVDSCFTLIRHKEKDWTSFHYDLNAVLTIHGFDIPPDRDDEYNQLIERISPIPKQYDCHHLQVKTDLRHKSKQDWEMSHLAQISSCIHLFSEHYDYGLIASSVSYKDPFSIWGSTTGTDFLLSGSNLELINDGAGYTRTEKIARISSNHLVTERLKVCWEKAYKNNCGECEKCYRTRLGLMTVGVYNPACFDTPISLKKIKKIKLKNASGILGFKGILFYAKKHNVQGAWLAEMRKAIIRGKLFFIPIEKLNKLRKRLKQYLKDHSKN